MTRTPDATSNGFADRSETTLAFDAPTRTVTLSPVGATFEVRVRGRDLRISAPLSAQWADTTGLKIAYIGDGGTLLVTESVIDEIITRFAVVAAIYWNATASQIVLSADERHGLMDGITHQYGHRAVGSTLDRSFGSLFGVTLDTTGNGDVEAHAQLDLATGRLIDEDLALASTETPQVLSPIAEIPVLYRLGAEWYLADADAWPMLYSGKPAAYTDTRVPVNEDSGGGVYVLTEISSVDFVLVHILAWNDVRHRVVAVHGSVEYNTLTAAREGAGIELAQMRLDGLPGPEFKALYSIVVQTANGYSNTPHARWRDNDTQQYVDWRSQSLVLTAPAATP
jgi:hypothetical protein